MFIINNHKQAALCNISSMDPRISFSNDFADTTQLSSIKHDNIYREAPVSSDFEFSVKNYTMISAADDIIFDGMLLPSKDNSTNLIQKTTLKDELLVDDDDDDYDQLFSRPPRSLGRWKELLRLKKAHILSKKVNKNNDGILERVVEDQTTTVFVHEAALIAKENQELLSEGGLRCTENAV
ncbi:hypothetical protein FNV43_RR22482 [Rhamnella rubrinervis]|uniref:Uncharacterized protein n=1 Tax=Rhamnella rubrinervis TaxID=2594499 RepID=A0A8K0DW98_9ROSA|nr:hypothetical protein FNV43_RR22482 [Rhamnella rubrinervis]